MTLASDPTLAETAELATQARRIGGPGASLPEEEVTAFIRESLAEADVDGRSVCLVVPDGTRSCPLPLLLGAIHGALAGRATRITVLIALGTHAAMGEAQLAAHLGYPEGELATAYPGMTVLNHEWWDPETLVSVGTITGERISELSEGRLDQPVDVRLNRHVVEHDVALVVGPVFPHEVVGFSGGNKYFFPGVAGQEVIDLSHWLGALITSADIIGTRGITPVRALINEAASLVPAERLALCLVVTVGQHRPARDLVRDPGVGVGSGGRGLRRDARALPRRARAQGAVDHAGEVRGHLDRSQGLLQARAGRGRRRRGDPLRAARHRRSPRCTPRSTRSATTAATTS